MKKNIIITAGGTEENIDNVRKITNMATGRLGALICNNFLDTKNKYINKIYYLSTKNAVKPIENEKIEFISIEETYDLKEQIEHLLKNIKIDYFIHSMAVSDYTTDYITTASLLAKYIEERNNKKDIEELIRENKNVLDTNKKISSSEDNLIIKLKPTPKIISIIKNISPETYLVGFKLLNNVSKEQLYDAAYKLLVKNKCDLVIGNDLADIKGNLHKALFITNNGIINEANTKKEIAVSLVKLLFRK